jgi:elongation factor Ts
MINNVEDIKKIREETQAGVMEIKKALEEANNKVEDAIKLLKEKGLSKAAKRADRTTGSGLVYAYVHGQGEIGVMIELNCETSFVAKTDEFKKLAHEICLQITSMQPANVDELLNQEYIRNPKNTIHDLVKELIAKTGENITVSRFTRYQIGDA